MVATAPGIALEQKVQEFLAKPRKLLIDGQWVEAASGKTFPVYDPATEEVVAQVAEGDAEDIDRAVRAAPSTPGRGRRCPRRNAAGCCGSSPI